MSRPFKGVTFWDRVYSHVAQDGECLIFSGCKDQFGYGRIHRDGRLVRIHRAVWERDHGSIPDGMVICHTCDRPACINPDHLFIGTQADNIADMNSKGRQRGTAGSDHPGAKLNEDAVLRIRDRLGAGESGASLAREYAVSESLIWYIKARRGWTHVT